MGVCFLHNYDCIRACSPRNRVESRHPGGLQHEPGQSRNAEHGLVGMKAQDSLPVLHGPDTHVSCLLLKFLHDVCQPRDCYGKSLVKDGTWRRWNCHRCPSSNS